MLVLTHSRPDGDGLGSAVALAHSARAAGKAVQLFVPDEIPPRYSFLFDGDAPAPLRSFEQAADGVDLIVIVDTCVFEQLDGLESPIRRRRDKVVVIDHHQTSQDIAAVQWIDASASATGVMVGELLAELGWPIDRETAEALVTAVVCDTGWFRFSNTDARTLRAVAGWLDVGARADRIYAWLYQCDRPERLELLRLMLGSLELHCDGRLAVMTLRRRDFQQSGARQDETENLINESLRLASVEAAMLLTENAECVRVSLRSREPVDVAEIAKRFGGGGHARAAGLRTSEDIDTAKQQLIDACREALRGGTGL